eukprot:c12158_g1_i1.p1 GENE.c12158_g1_i1~~c12158_g1_i1.p1  ORF type:complete len:691 (-),score=241.59 c12158_g1_i1:170-2242(-)
MSLSLSLKTNFLLLIITFFCCCEDESVVINNESQSNTSDGEKLIRIEPPAAPHRFDLSAVKGEIKIPQSLYLGANILVDYKLSASSLGGWFGVYKSDSDSCSDWSCWLTWSALPKDQLSGLIHVYNPMIKEPGNYVIRYCIGARPFISCPVVSNNVTIHKMREGIRNPILLIPGVGGSVLNYTGPLSSSASPTTQRAWVTLDELSTPSPDKIFMNYLRCLYNSTTGHCEQTDSNYKIDVLDSNFGIDGVAILDPFSKYISRNQFSESLWYFHDLVQMLELNGWNRGDTIRAVPYDFRQSNDFNATVSRVYKALTDLYELNSRRVTIVTHSMGGIVLSSCIAVFGDEFLSKVNIIFTIAAPFRGAGALSYKGFLTGYAFDNPVISSESARQSVTSFPSVYQMIPPPNYSWNIPRNSDTSSTSGSRSNSITSKSIPSKPPCINITFCAEEYETFFNFQDFTQFDNFAEFRDIFTETITNCNNVTNVIIEPKDINEFLSSVLKTQKTQFNFGKNGFQTLPNPFRSELYYKFLNLSNSWNNIVKIQRRHSFMYYNIFGQNLSTPHSLIFPNGLKIGEEAKGNFHIETDSGDGTVLEMSASAPFMTPFESFAVVDGHQSLVKNGLIMNYIMEKIDLNTPKHATFSNHESKVFNATVFGSSVGLVGAAGLIVVILWRKKKSKKEIINSMLSESLME